MLNIIQNASLKDYSTMRLGGSTSYLTEVFSRSDMEEAFIWAKRHDLPIIVIGSGSNIVWRDEGFKGLLVVNKIRKFEKFAEDETNYYFTIGAGELWEDAVGRMTQDGLSGVECLSLIPGTTGATPIQNVGAYGQEISNVLVSVEAYDTVETRFINIAAADCGFGYRTSRFKTTDRGRFLITAITLHLTKSELKPPFYGSLQAYLDENNIRDYSPASVRAAVTAIRSAKLPDPAKVANNGSFFANPIVSEAALTQLAADHGDVPHWQTSSGQVKIAAAWLIEQAGFKDVHDTQTGMATWHKQPLVLVNENALRTEQLLAFRQKILDAVERKFSISLKQEPELLPVV